MGHDYSKIPSLPFTQRNVVNGVLDIIQSYEQQIAALRKDLDMAQGNQNGQPLVPYKYIEENLEDKLWSKNYSFYGQNKTAYPLFTVEQLKAKLLEEETVLEQNKAIVTSNQACFEAARNFLLRLGLRETKNERISARSYKTREKTSAWYTDLRACFVLDDGWSTVTAWYARQIDAIERYTQDEAKKRLEAEKQEQARKLADEKIALFAILAAKYKVKSEEVIPDVDEIQEALFAKDKYLALAYALYRNRCDYSDGCDVARGALEDFEVLVQTNQDAQIANSVANKFEDFDDGRVFASDYNALFSLADPEILEDFKKLSKFLEHPL